MSKKIPSYKIIFGLKVKQLRSEKGHSLKELAASTGMSISYLNEIEKGKKYPKDEKISILAKALDTEIAYLKSPDLVDGLAPLGALLNSNFLNELPLELFGIELSKVAELIANAPAKVGAFISTLVELSRTYAVHEENFYFRALRSYQELHNNYFEDIEDEAEAFVKHHKIPINGAVPFTKLAEILIRDYNYTIVEDGLNDYPSLGNQRSIFNPKTKKLLLNGKLNDMQKAFHLAKELGFNYLGLSPRPYTSRFIKVNSFDEVLNNYKAAYFAVAIMIHKDSFVNDLKSFFGQAKWNPQFIEKLAEKYQASNSVLFQRFNLFPNYFGLNKMFFIRSFYNSKNEIFTLDKELHLNHSHRPHGNGLHEHYCRRWLSLSLLKKVSNDSSNDLTQPLFGVQRSRYHGSEDEYLVMAVARPSYPQPNKSTSVTIGVLLNKEARNVIKFADDPSIPTVEVNVTCERCPIKDCKERGAEPTFILKKEKRKKIEDSLKQLMKE